MRRSARRRFLLAAATAALLVGAGCRRPAGPTRSGAVPVLRACGPCAAGYRCVQGLCQAVCTPACAEGLLCHQGACIPSCEPPCISGFHCDRSRTCVPGDPFDGPYEPTQEYQPPPSAEELGFPAAGVEGT